MNLTINTTSSPFTLDMYATFTSDSAEENILENLREENPAITYDDLDWTYDHETVHRELADLWCEFVLENIPAITQATTTSIYSPKYYNYTTDSADIDITYDSSIIDTYIQEHAPQYLAYCRDRSYHIESPLENDEEKICYYLEGLNLSDDWTDYAYEKINETIYNALDYTIKPTNPTF